MQLRPSRTLLLGSENTYDNRTGSVSFLFRNLVCCTVICNLVYCDVCNLVYCDVRNLVYCDVRNLVYCDVRNLVCCTVCNLVCCTVCNLVYCDVRNLVCCTVCNLVYCDVRNLVSSILLCSTPGSGRVTAAFSSPLWGRNPQSGTAVCPLTPTQTTLVCTKLNSCVYIYINKINDLLHKINVKL